MSSNLSRLTAVVGHVCALVNEMDDGELTVIHSTPGVVRPQRAAAAESLVESIRMLSDDHLQMLLSEAGSGRAELDRVISIAAGEIAKRSRRELGHSGLAQRAGHPSATRLVQVLTGESPTEARRQVRIGELLGEADAVPPASESSTPLRDAPVLPWQHPVTTAINSGEISPELGHLIVRTLDDVSESCPVEDRRAAASELVEYATREPGSGNATDTVAGMPRDDLQRRARLVRDRIDAHGVADRFERRYQKRSLKTWRDADGSLNLLAVADDESGVFLTQLFDLALSPRRGGPRFMSSEDRAWENALSEDPRSNTQLMFDTFIQVVRDGAGCDESSVFRGKRPGVRVITVVDTVGVDGVHDDEHDGVLEGSADAVPAAFIQATACDCGIVPITVDRSGRALNLGRTQRTFSAAQRVVLAARDGGCLWPGCEIPAWQTEAHHNNEWEADHGRTDIADGVLLCKFHHLNLHNNRWRIRRRGTEYELVPPPVPGAVRRPIPLRPKSTTWERVRSSA
ncbi:HNH endonuclease signature motif containing protein [Humibacter sp. RRB41]|uniref:HNH endonuclease signature motif containing protein n=1 Tax=Humibacter sp. RRB41 TaxID=2919946 RepID=UPI001FAA546B|nr:HNH endonuclease signature motif containing protein [Humibacter sp. RRB41]